MTKRPPVPTIDDVARHAGVSIATVSRVINRTVPVSNEVMARVEAAMAELRYTPRAAARNLATRKTNTLGLLVSDIIGDFFAPLLSGIEDVTNEHGYDLLISTAGRRGPHDALPGSLGSHNTDGLLLFDGALSDAGLLRAHDLGLPAVLIYQAPPPNLPIPSVTIENKAATRAIVEHLIIVHGRRRIVLLQGLPRNDDSRWRALGYREALELHGLPYDPALVAPGDFERTVAYATVTQLIERGVDFDGIFTGDDEAAVGALLALHAGGRRVPQDVSVVGFDDQRLAAVLAPPLTTVHAPTAQVGAEAAQQLIRLIHTGQADALTLLPTQLVIRRSCGCGG